MFVRWKTREHWRTKYKQWPKWRTKEYNGKSFSAVLVRSERIDGKPRQKIVAYLGHIKEKSLDSKARRLYFWESVDRHLDTLVLSLAERQRIEEQLRERIPRPTLEEMDGQPPLTPPPYHRWTINKEGASAHLLIVASLLEVQHAIAIFVCFKSPLPECKQRTRWATAPLQYCGAAQTREGASRQLAVR
jgi:hypothetical protein